MDLSFLVIRMSPTYTNTCGRNICDFSKKRIISFELRICHRQESIRKFRKPIVRGLFKSIWWLLKFADTILPPTREPGWNLHANLLIQITMWKNIINSNLMNGPTVHRDNGEKTPNSDRLHNRGKSLMLIQTFCLSIAFSNKTHFGALHCSICSKFDTVNSFTAD